MQAFCKRIHIDARNNKSGINQLDSPEFQGISVENTGNNRNKNFALKCTYTHPT
jgi:hypothetical protein